MGDKSPSEPFRNADRAVQVRHCELDTIFADLRRSVAFAKLERMRALGLLTEEQYPGFCEELPPVVGLLLDL